MDNRIATTLVGMKTPAEVESNLVAEATPVNRELLDEVLAALAPVKNQRWDSGLFKAQG
jgi:aryl-alcohol dehydrogenase-like predicted oxidoreductase